MRIHCLSLRLAILPYLIYSHLREPSEDKCERTQQTQLTLLSQLPTARKSATGQKEREEIASGGGSATSISFSGEDETFAVVEFVPKKAMVQQELSRITRVTSTLVSDETSTKDRLLKGA